MYNCINGIVFSAFNMSYNKKCSGKSKRNKVAVMHTMVASEIFVGKKQHVKRVVRIHCVHKT